MRQQATRWRSFILRFQSSMAWQWRRWLRRWGGRRRRRRRRRGRIRWCPRLHATNSCWVLGYDRDRRDREIESSECLQSTRETRRVKKDFISQCQTMVITKFIIEAASRWYRPTRKQKECQINCNETIDPNSPGQCIIMTKHHGRLGIMWELAWTESHK